MFKGLSSLLFLSYTFFTLLLGLVVIVCTFVLLRPDLWRFYTVSV